VNFAYYNFLFITTFHLVQFLFSQTHRTSQNKAAGNPAEQFNQFQSVCATDM